ncbi:isoeugenol synthase 1-like isoform X1 [Magnolia sinica]|uniref:isoeugenol synthase 1-like isoform X1 n=1 Tax=Magnolia sinica TaxID=86752 RepID=UPI00265B55DC|nr:isoeugenol synthase 1-like isoform X1 [Magnolia sinica]
MATQSKILIIGATGYIGKYMLKASLSMGHPTYVYSRPTSDPSKLELLQELESMGVKVFQGELHEHDKLVSVIQQVDVVISTLPVPQYLEQLKIIDAIKDAGTIKRFIPSEYGNEVDRVSALPPFQAVLDMKKRIRRATEAAGIPHTFVSGNSFAAYFVDYFLHPHEEGDEVLVYGSGEAKAVLNFEKDVATYTIMAANDPRTCNRLIIYRPPGNIISMLDLISSWEKKTGRTFKKTYIPEEEAVKLSETLPHPHNIPVAILHSIFIKGDQMSFELEENDLEASNLYSEYKYTSIDQYLNLCAVDPPKTQRAAFA